MPGSNHELSSVCSVQGLSSAADGQAHKGTQAGAPVVEATTQSPAALATDNGGTAQPAAAPADATQRSEIQVRCSLAFQAVKATPCSSASVIDGNVMAEGSLPMHCRQLHLLRRPSLRQQGRQCVRTRSSLRGAFALGEALNWVGRRLGGPCGRSGAATAVSMPCGKAQALVKMVCIR